MNDHRPIIIDGSQGEGGGQIIRSSLALSLVTGRAFEIYNIRAGRNKPGLMRQHLVAVRAAAEVARASVKGDAIGSRDLKFKPGLTAAGDYTYSIATAGSTTLVMQTVLPALMLADGPSRVTFEGVTHNTFAPPFDFLEKVYLPLLARMGPQAKISLEKHGFYPAGGGRFTLQLQPVEKLAPLDLPERGDIQRRHVRALVSRLPMHIARRECDTIAAKTGWDKSCFTAEEVTTSPGPGNVVLIEIESDHITELFTGFGKIGVKAEHVALETLQAARRYSDSGVPVGEHLADQLLLPMGIGAWQGTGGGMFRTHELSLHSKTHINILHEFLDIDVQVQEVTSQVNEVTISRS